MKMLFAAPCAAPFAALLIAACMMSSTVAQASDLCDAERNVAMTIAKARDRGVPEEKVDEQLRQTFPDTTQQRGVIALANVIYTSADMKTMSPEDIGGAVGNNCVDTQAK